MDTIKEKHWGSKGIKITTILTVVTIVVYLGTV